MTNNPGGNSYGNRALDLELFDMLPPEAKEIAWRATPNLSSEELCRMKRNWGFTGPELARHVQQLLDTRAPQYALQAWGPEHPTVRGLISRWSR